MPKILVADDNTNIQKMVSLAFSERGIDVISVGNGEAAVRRLPELIPDLVLADIFMPVRNGYEVCEYVKNDPRFSHIPVILLVGAFDPLDEKEARRVGADGVLKKPFVPPDPLIAMVTSVLERNPKLAAELSATKKAALGPAEQTKTDTTQGKAAKKIPTEFPEPTSENAAEMYGYDSGRRALDPATVPADAQAPVSDAEGIDEFDGAATSRDWRRTARDFEISEEASARPAFAEDQMNSQAPSLKSDNAPPQVVRVTEPTEKIEPVVKVAAPGTIKGPEPTKVHEVPELTEAFQVAEVSADFARAPKTEKAPEFTEPAEEPEVRETPLVEAEAGQEPRLTPKAAGWFDSIFPAKYPKGGWLSSITGSAAKPEPTETQASAANSSPVSHSEVEESFTASRRQTDAEIAPDSIEPPTPAPALRLEAMDEESFFADELEVSEPEVVSTPAAMEEVPKIDSRAAVPEPVAAAQNNVVKDVWPAPERAIFADTDPALVEPPAVRVVPEPLLVGDEAQVFSTKYGGRSEELPPLHSFLVPAPQAPDAEEPAGKAPNLNNDPEVLQAQSPIEESERIPTGPPSSREALSEILFLSPPPEFHQAPAPSAAAVNSEMVDAVVRKVLERLEPQLHELLSRDLLKPIVENILQNGNQKADH